MSRDSFKSPQAKIQLHRDDVMDKNITAGHRMQARVTRKRCDKTFRQNLKNGPLFNYGYLYIIFAYGI